MPPGSPFGPDLSALIVHLHVTQAIGFERLAQLLDEVFGIRISEGAIANLIARAQTPLAASAATIAAEVRASPVVASDETSARVKGQNWWQWVLLSSTAIHHLIADSRGAAVLDDFLGDAKPEVWVADRYAAQAGHADERQLCLAHLLRDAQYAPGLRRGRLASGDTGFAPGFHKLLQRAVGIGQRRADLKDSTLAQYRADLDRRLDRLLAATPTTEAGRKLAQGIRKCRGDLFLFITRRDVPATNNDCERALRPSVIFRKVTGGFRSDWAPKPTPPPPRSSPPAGCMATQLYRPSKLPSPDAPSSCRPDQADQRVSNYAASGRRCHIKRRCGSLFAGLRSEGTLDNAPEIGGIRRSTCRPVRPTRSNCRSYSAVSGYHR
jgi:transposase